MAVRRRSVAYRSSAPARGAQLNLALLTDRELLRMRLCDLGVRLAGSELGARVDAFQEGLEARGLVFRPHVWLSTDWFSPDGVPGFAIPFYLAHPRLLALEQQQMRDVEGGSPQGFLQLMRHETAHALDSAYRLHERADWRETFGRFEAAYRQHYLARPGSKRFVRHLPNHYAQSHPAEDFAETVAVWLDPDSRWRTRYRDWPALAKLVYVNRLMREIGSAPPLVRIREQVEPVSSLTDTLGAYYEDKRRRYRVSSERSYQRDLLRLFRERRSDLASTSAAAYLRQARPELRKLVADRTGAFQYDIDRVLREMIRRSSDFDLVVPPDAKAQNGRYSGRIAAQLARYLAQGRHLIAR